jgi:thiamine-phosphate pyrophosphorylase
MAQRLPRGAAIVYRAFGAPDALQTALALKAVARRRGLTLLIGADAALAHAARADGVHLPERLAYSARALKAVHGNWLITAAAHSPAAARRASRAGADAVVVSAIFESASPSARRPMGALRLACLVRRVSAPVYALGGVDNKKARRLLASGVTGIAGVGAFRT